MAATPIYLDNDLDVGFAEALSDARGALGTGLTITAFLSTTAVHGSTADIDASLSATLAESGSTALYTGYIDKADITTHLASRVGQTVYLHREDSTSYWTVETCKVYASRRV